MRKLWLLLAIAGVVVVAGLFALRSAPVQLEFDKDVWKANPASSRWVNENIRYRMSRAAAMRAQSCRDHDEVLRLLGEPDGSGDYAQGGPATSPSDSFIYWLGFTRHPVLFWEVDKSVKLNVIFDQRGRVLDTSIELEP